VSIDESSISATPPAGFAFLGQQVSITAPPATTTDPLVLVFRIDSSLIPAGENQNTIQIFKDGVAILACSGAPGEASPDPCISNRALLGDGDVQITVLTSTASEWNFGLATGPTCNGFPATIVGTRRSNVIIGTNGRDVIVALGGADLIFGGNGDDVICAGDGNDIVFGGHGQDIIFGEDGRDTLFGDGGSDEIYGGDGKDTLSGDSGDDYLDGGPARDACDGGPGDDTTVACEVKPRDGHDDD